MFLRVARRAGLIAVGILFLAALGPRAARSAGIDVAISPAAATVAPLEIFDLELTIPLAGDPFNAYETTITFDPAQLTFLQLSPVSLQEGSLMTGACGLRFHSFSEVAGSITLSHVLLCAGTSVAGPGVTYLLRFQAPATDAITHVRFEDIGFANAGVRILPVRPTDAVIYVGDAVGVPGEGEPTLRIGLGVPFPNPFRTSARIPLQVPPGTAVKLDVFDLTGRRVRLLEATDKAAVWDGTNDQGVTVPAGVYFVRLRAGDISSVRRVIRIR